MRVCVFCGSSPGSRPIYLEGARAVGRALAERGVGVVYGGASVGCMGAVADAALEAGGEVIGVIPEALVGSEVAHTGCTRLEVVPGMHERKKAFTDLSDGFVTIPGGVGTMDELWEAVSWAQLGYHRSPVGLLNAFGFYDGLLEFNAKMIEVGFIRPAHQGIIVARETIPELLTAMADYEPHTPIFAMKADDL